MMMLLMTMMMTCAAAFCNQTEQPVAPPHQAQLADLKFFAKPKLGLDAVGGQATLKLCEELAEVGRLLMLHAESAAIPQLY